MKIWPWSVIADLHEERGRLVDHIRNLQNIAGKQNAIISQQLSAINSGLGRIIAKVDPLYGLAEDDPQRIADSRRLEVEIIAKLQAEHQILKSRHLLPTDNWDKGAD